MIWEWIDDLRRALDRQYGRELPVATLATVDRSGAPHARSVICRRIDDEGNICVVSDARTEKNEQVRGDGRVEMVFWLSELQTQFRAAGTMRIVALGQDETMRRELWQSLTDPVRALFFWPTPGIAVAADDVYPQAVSADVPPPKAFELLILKPQQVERLLLSHFPHRRRRWRADANWNGVDINP
jgi:PPOX class probable FMN-dependent enzyme